ncbi:hypothetical protein [Mycoplasma parvum]|uniref:Uncharacterized protein n=1 Tax=Mycoplasma parvum str. Indiana TaxID=1403316 RepID=U5NC08_9MOLU|nr:hypothetical protein [Mycoplasma parvum]AGX88937.1 hypothetical protein PRV_00860 [Mycoplasma parvum str. Indiana]
MLGITGDTIGQGLKRSELLINSSLETRKGELNKLKIKNPWFKLVNENQGQYYYGEVIKNTEQSENSGEAYFDVWEDNANNNNNQGEWDSLKKMLLWFMQCKGARAWIVGNAEIKGSFNSNHQGAGWVYGDLKRKIREVDPEILKISGNEALLENQLAQGNELCNEKRNQIRDLNSGLSISTKNKIQQLPKRKGWVIFFKKGGGALSNNSENTENEIKENVYFSGVVLEQKNTNWIDRKIRIVHIEKGNNLIYIDEWLEPILAEDIEKFRISIGKRNNCQLKGDFDNDESEFEIQVVSNCQGKFIKKEINWFRNKNKAEELEYFDSSANGEWKRIDAQISGLYGENAGQMWDQLKSKIEREYVWWRREVGVVWNGKVFKWRSF